MRNSFVENRATQTESMMDAHSESQPMPFMKVSNNGFTNMGRIPFSIEKAIKQFNPSQHSTTAGQSFILSDENTEVQSQETVT